jgi:hypothetical protein
MRHTEPPLDLDPPAGEAERAFVAAVRATLAPPVPLARWVVVALLVERREDQGRMRPELLVFEPRRGWQARLLTLDPPLASSPTPRAAAESGVFIAAACGDLDGDETRSLVCGLSYESGPCRLLRFGLDQDDPTPEVLLELGEEVGFVRSLAVGDLDGGRPRSDRRPTIVANRVGVYDSKLDRIDPYSDLHLYRVAGPSIERERLATLDRAIKSRGFALGDVDGDGRDELVAGTRTLDIAGHGETSLLLFKWDARRARSREVLAKSGPFGPHCVAVADVDGDGRAEMSPPTTAPAVSISMIVQREAGGGGRWWQPSAGSSW